MSTLASIFDPILLPLSYSFVQRAVLAASVMAVVAGLLSCWLILVGWSLLGDAVSHAVLPGVVLAYIFGAPFAVGAMIAALIAVGLVGSVKERTTLREDTSIGIIFTTFFALGLVLLSITPSGTHLQEILFGNLLGITQSALWQILAIGGIAFVVLLANARTFTLWAFDAEHSRTMGFNTKAIRWVLLACLACVVVASAQAVGVILVVAMLITPGATAYLWTRRFRRMLLIAPLVAWVSCVAGILLSFNLNVSTGGTIVLVQSGIFCLTYLFAPREGLMRALLARR
ncbi:MULTISPECIES: metal ABC transporter permease [unclassified Corynebacterium]|uniref:metal ABC transporter permease n=1 Tax=unclassified Corynebacterium TaxID=2624378 RepID=UPI001EF2888F|nr:metal ABC transporter permease [Corynebacterium sp. ACRPH]MCG7457026.1 metal ABC transporter permease [Corynebacterium sp. ACRPH]